jgi:hypothetical protein
MLVIFAVSAKIEVPETWLARKNSLSVFRFMPNPITAPSVLFDFSGLWVSDRTPAIFRDFI